MCKGTGACCYCLCCGGKSALHQVQTSNDTCFSVESKLPWVQDRAHEVIFTCLASRAVHLEMAHSLDTDLCINAHRRFICRRGQVNELRSDNGTNFIATEWELKEALKAWNQDKINKALQQKGVKWTFNPPAAAHHGGVWERLIRSLKRILLSVKLTKDDESLITVMCEVEAILNNRPLTTVSDDPNERWPQTTYCYLECSPCSHQEPLSKRTCT